MSYSKESILKLTMDLLKEEMTNDQVGVRVNAIHRAEIIAAALPEVVESELIPYLDSKFV